MLPCRTRALVSVVMAATLAACAPESPSENALATEDVSQLRSLLDEFLAHADVASAHERFWAEDLVYTSSNGTRTDKGEILSGFESPADEEEPGPTYHAEDVDIRLYGATAVVAFRLVITPPEGSTEAPSSNLNTGTLVKRDGVWRAVAWQSTRTPG